MYYKSIFHLYHTDQAATERRKRRFLPAAAAALEVSLFPYERNFQLSGRVLTLWTLRHCECVKCQTRG